MIITFHFDFLMGVSESILLQRNYFIIYKLNNIWKNKIKYSRFHPNIILSLYKQEIFEYCQIKSHIGNTCAKDIYDNKTVKRRYNFHLIPSNNFLFQKV